MRCNFEEKTILFAYGEIKDENVGKHIRECEICNDIYSFILKTKEMMIDYNSNLAIDNKILDYATEKIFLKKVKNLFLSLSFSVVSLFIFIIPFKFNNNNATDNKINVIEEELESINDFMNLDIFDF